MRRLWTWGLYIWCIVNLLSLWSWMDLLIDSSRTDFGRCLDEAIFGSIGFDAFSSLLGALGSLFAQGKRWLLAAAFVVPFFAAVAFAVFYGNQFPLCPG